MLLTGAVLEKTMTSRGIHDFFRVLRKMQLFECSEMISGLLGDRIKRKKDRKFLSLKFSLLSSPLETRPSCSATTAIMNSDTIELKFLIFFSEIR